MSNFIPVYQLNYFQRLKQNYFIKIINIERVKY